jgi:hypothetical protein
VSTSIIIHDIQPTLGYEPTSGTDALDVSYMAWALTNEAQFSFEVPGEYTGASDLVLRFHESTPGSSLKHKWQAVVTLNAAVSQTFTAEYTSHATANTLSTRNMTISTGGNISTTAITAGALISVTLSRIAASGSEDGNAINIYLLAAIVTVSALSAPCLGRVGAIIDKVLTLSNDKKQGFVTAAEVLIWINGCISDIAVDGYWPTTGTVDVIASQESYDLNILFPSMSQVLGVQWTDTTMQLFQLIDWDHYTQAKLWMSSFSSGYGYAYLIEGGSLFLAPVPTESIVAGLLVHYYYLPDDVECLENYDPPTPKAFDDVYVKYCVAQAALKDRFSSDAASNFQTKMALYVQAKQSLFRRRGSSDLRLRPYR